MFSKFEQFSIAISVIYQDIQKIQRAVMAQMGMKGPHAQFLLVLNHFPEGVTAAQLSQLCEKDKAAISRMVAELEQMEMVHRRLAGGSRYRASITLTEKGREFARSVNKAAEEAVNLAVKGIQEEDSQLLLQTLTRLAENLHTIREQGLPEEKE